MFNLLQTASDDQTAIGGCLLALIGASFFVFLSFHLGPAGQKLRKRERDNLEVKLHSRNELPAASTQDRAA